MSKTRKYIRIMCVILSIAALLTSAAGCSRKSNKNEKVLKQIINNPDSYPQLSFAEFNTLINGKTGLSAAELPRDKACDTGDNGYDFTRYIVGGEFIFSCYINSKKPDQSMYSLSYFENGSIVECGTHDELMKLCGKYAYMFDVQSHYYKEDAENA